MGKSLKRYTEEFKREAVGVVRSTPDRSVGQIAKELGVDRKSLSEWVSRFGPRPESPGGPQVDLQAENRRLRRDLERVEQERDILKKAIAIFSDRSR